VDLALEPLVAHLADEVAPALLPVEPHAHRLVVVAEQAGERRLCAAAIPPPDNIRARAESALLVVRVGKWDRVV
jgi:hypothetical protein